MNSGAMKEIWSQYPIIQLTLKKRKRKKEKVKTFVKTFRGKISHERIDTYVNLVLKTLDPEDYYDLEFQQDDGWQYIRIEVWDRVLH